MISEKHPINEFMRLVEDFPNAVFEFSKYINLGYGKTESRDIFTVQAKFINNDWLDEKLHSLSKRQELALHSRIYIDSKLFHLPMIDFINVKSVEETDFEIENISEKINSEIFYYDSGQSLHGYYFRLLEEKIWFEYLGSLLLCNQPSLDCEIIDTRWIGHCLENGFSALRWSQNSEIYKSIPKIIKRDEFSYT